MNLFCTTSVTDILRILTILSGFFLLYSVLRNPRFCLLGAYRHLFYSHSLFHWAWELKHAEYRTLDKHITLSKTDPTLQCLCWLHIHYYSLYNQTCLPACLISFFLSLSLPPFFLLCPSLPSCSSHTHLRSTVFQEHSVASVVISVHVDSIPHARTCSCYWIWNLVHFAKYPHIALPINPWQPFKSQCLWMWLLNV